LGLALLSIGGKAVSEGVEAVEKSCRLGFSVACTHSFRLYEAVPESRTRDFAARLEESRCASEKEAIDACKHAASAYEHGWGVAASTEKAERYRRRACAMAEARCRELTRHGTDGERSTKMRACLSAERACPEPEK